MKAEARAVLADLRLQSSLADTLGCKAVLRTPLAAKEGQRKQSSRSANQSWCARLALGIDGIALRLCSYIQGQGAAAGRESADCVRTAKRVALKRQSTDRRSPIADRSIGPLFAVCAAF